ncbi:MAG: HTH domain-containing protein [Acidobacteria bacterium]|nr:HTH domain-containing protein [Acidobacteriota bacterium]MBI3486615.1 HTH domain-containing protein [Acidobacteriota bacterium]
MNRLDRHYALAECLRRPGGSTIPWLAAELGVTERTIQRDLAQLRGLGLAVEGEPGRGGGIRLKGPSLPPPLGLSLGEALVVGGLECNLLLQNTVDHRRGVLPLERAAF